MAGGGMYIKPKAPTKTKKRTKFFTYSHREDKEN